MNRWIVLATLGSLLGLSVCTMQRTTAAPPVMDQSAQSAERLDQLISAIKADPDAGFAGLSIDDGTLTIHLTNTDLDMSSYSVPEGYSIALVKTAYALADYDAVTSDIARQLSDIGLNVSFGFDLEIGHVEFLTLTHGAAIEAAIQSGKLSLPADYSIVAEEIVPTGG